MPVQKYLFVLLVFLYPVFGASAQCLTLPFASESQLVEASKILEGRVAQQKTFIGTDGNIYTSNQIEVYRVFKGDVGFDETVITEGGVFGDLMQVVTPSVQLQVGDYGLMVLQPDAQREFTSLATAFYSIDERSGSVYGLKGVTTRESLNVFIGRSIGSQTIELRRIPLDLLEDETGADRAALQLTSVFPLEVTAGTRMVLTITGQGFGEEQGSGHVAFTNANDGGQSFVALQPGPHYLSWTDTEIQLYVPSATLYNNTVAGTGKIRITTSSGQTVTSMEEVDVDYAKSEVVYNENLNNTMLVGMQDGGYLFHMNQQLESLISGGAMVRNSFEKWACNTGVNFRLDDQVVSNTDWAHDEVNLIGLSTAGQLPSYLLGKTVTTFSGCGTPEGIQWNLVEVDILFNSDINWWLGEGQPMANRFDLATSLLHEIGHAHLLQHNNDGASPMYFQLTEGSMRRDLNAHTDIQGGGYVVEEAVTTQTTCGDDLHQLYDFSTCSLSVINGVSDHESEAYSVYPNPFENQLTISGDQNFGDQYTIFDALGRTVSSGMITSTLFTVPTTHLPSGIYLLEVQSKTGRQVKRLVKN